jgi:hypothetical protein
MKKFSADRVLVANGEIDIMVVIIEKQKNIVSLQL